MENEAYFIHVMHGNHVAITPSEVMEISEGNLTFSVEENLILKGFPNKNKGIYQSIIIHIDRGLILNTLTRNFPDISSSVEMEYSFDTITGKPSVITQKFIEGMGSKIYRNSIEPG